MYFKNVVCCHLKGTAGTFYKGDVLGLLFAFMHTSLLIRGLFEKKRFTLQWSTFFPIRVDPFSVGR